MDEAEDQPGLALDQKGSPPPYRFNGDDEPDDYLEIFQPVLADRERKWDPLYDSSSEADDGDDNDLKMPAVFDDAKEDEPLIGMFSFFTHPQTDLPYTSKRINNRSLFVNIHIVPIEGWPNYLIAADGSVWDSVHNRFLPQVPINTGYFGVHLGGKRPQLVHRLVAAAFLGPPPSPEYTCINHVDGDKSNNHVANLEWSTHSENMRQSHRTGLRNPYPRSTPMPASLTAALAAGEDGNLDWKPVPDQDGLPLQRRIWVGRDGRVFNCKTSRLLGEGLRPGNTLRTVSLPGKRKTLIHRLVATLFVPKPGPGFDRVTFLDGDKDNLQAENLAWQK